MSIDKYLFWYMIQGVTKKLDDLTEYKENNWLENLSFKENLKEGIKIFDNLLEQIKIGEISKI